MKRIEEMRQRKKIVSQGSDSHQQMMMLFEDRLDAFAAGFESSQSSIPSDDAVPRKRDRSPFPDIERMKMEVAFRPDRNMIRSMETETNEEISNRKLKSFTLTFLKEDKMKEAFKTKLLSKTLGNEDDSNIA